MAPSIKIGYLRTINMMKTQTKELPLAVVEEHMVKEEGSARKYSSQMLCRLSFISKFIPGTGRR